jgi:peptidyl-prolyl cis-trans isomerase C
MSRSIIASAPGVSPVCTPTTRLLSPRAIWRRVRREPLLQFVALGTLIFAVTHFAQRERSMAERRIIVDEQVQRRIVQVSQTQTGITPGPEQLKRLVDDYIDDEVMYREALRLGLDQDDEIIRRRLIQKAQFLQRDLATAPQPAEDELRAYYNAHPELFTSAMSVTFEQHYFSADHGGWTRAERRTRQALDQLQREPAGSEALPDDAFPLQIPAEDLTQAAAVRLFGDTPIVGALFSSPEGQWSEPVRSAYGWHLIKVDHRRPSSVAAFSQVRAQVESAYMQERTDVAQRRELAALRARYDIVRPGKPGGGS